MKPVALVNGLLSLALVSLLDLPRSLRADELARTDSQKLEHFERFIRPVLVEHCYECHSSGATSVEGELRLDSRDAALTGGTSGKALVPGDPGASLLVKALRYEEFEMPPTKRLPEEVVRHFEQWVADGAVDPRVDANPSSESHKSTKLDWSSDAARDFWSLKPPRPQALPGVRY